MRIAILGTRGIPARYGGFETFAEKLALGLSVRGHQVTVYGRRRFFEKGARFTDWQGIRLRRLPTVMHKYLETPLHALTSLLATKRGEFDLILLCNAANAPFAWIATLRGIPVLINVDGIERRRAKWNFVGRSWYRLGEICSMLFCSKVIADAESIARYYRIVYGINPEIVAYGAQDERKPPGDTLAKFGLQPKQYLLYVSRLEPENNALGVIRAYVQSGVKFPLVVVGDAPYADEYKLRLREAAASARERVIFTGFQFGHEYQELQTSCYFYIQATEVGGTHPALIEAMAYGNGVIANGTPENVEVLGLGGCYYWRNDFDHLAERIRQLVDDESLVAVLGRRNSARAERLYSWERITGQYEKLFATLVGNINDLGVAERSA